MLGTLAPAHVNLLDGLMYMWREESLAQRRGEEVDVAVGVALEFADWERNAGGRVGEGRRRPFYPVFARGMWLEFGEFLASGKTREQRWELYDRLLVVAAGGGLTDRQVAFWQRVSGTH